MSFPESVWRFSALGGVECPRGHCISSNQCHSCHLMIAGYEVDCEEQSVSAVVADLGME